MKRWAVDASISTPDGIFCFVPVEGEGENLTFVTGLNYLSDKPPHGEKVVMVIHEDGQEAVDEWLAKNGKRLDESLNGPKKS